MGNRSKPVAMHLLQGTYRKDRHSGGLALEQKLWEIETPECAF